MPIQRTRTIGSLYDEAKKYDLVFTTDGPLSLALNRRLDQPRLGRFAVTPRMLASGTFRPEDERGLFTGLVTETDLSWKHASYLVSNVLSYWEETGGLDGILSYDRYDSAATREAIRVIREANSSSSSSTPVASAKPLTAESRPGVRPRTVAIRQGRRLVSKPATTGRCPAFRSR